MSCVYLFLTPNSRSVFRAEVQLNIHSFIHSFIIKRERDVAPWEERSLMVRWVVGSIFMVDPVSYFSFQPVIHDWCNKGCGMCHPLYGMMRIKEQLLLIGKSRTCGGSRFPLSLSEWSFTICLTPYNCK